MRAAQVICGKADKRHVKKQNFIVVCWAVCCATALLNAEITAAQSYQYGPTLQASWQYHSAKGSCMLELPLADFGVARFVATRDTHPSFELQARKDWHAPGPLTATVYAPAWHPQSPLKETLGELLHISRGGAIARDGLASTMLQVLRQGLHLELVADAWFDQPHPVGVHVSARDFQPALDQFLSCAHTEVKVSWQAMSRTRVAYAVDEYSLTDADKSKLEALARYVQSDPTVTEVFVDGHTDASGTERANHKLSKHRAEAVAAYLGKLGVPAEQLVVRYHGAAYPVADNQSIAGKAQNRRTTVRLARGAPERVAQN